MKAPVLTTTGTKSKDIELPEVFAEDYKPGLIKRAVVAQQSNSFQPHAPYEYAGLQTSAEYIGRRSAFRTAINVASARLPTTKPGGGGRGEVRRVPHSKGGRRAHPPKVEKIVKKEINKKEKRAAMRSAIAATANKEVVEKRHAAAKNLKSLPIILEDKFQDMTKTKDVVNTLNKIGLTEDLQRALKKKMRAGKQKRRGKKTRQKKSVLVVYGKGAKVYKACKNIPGVDSSSVAKLNVELLAPGTHAGRLTVWTASAVKEVGEKYGN